MPRPRLHDRDLPQNVYLRRGTYFFRVPNTGKWLNLGKDEVIARDKCRALTGPQRMPVDASSANLDLADEQRLIDYARRAYAVARSRALARGTRFSLTTQEVVDLLIRSGGRCEVSEIPFNVTPFGKRGLRPWMPSLDRIEACEGYVQGNVRVVCVAANIALSDFGDAVFLRLAIAVAERQISSTLSAEAVEFSPMESTAYGA